MRTIIHKARRRRVDIVYTPAYCSEMRRRTAGTAIRSTVINLRADEPRKALIDRAAEAVGKNRSEFMLDAATREATAVLLDRRLFELDARAFKQFTTALDAAPGDNRRLRKLLATKAPWEQ